MMAEQEYATLKAAMLQQKLGNESNSERSACLVALCDLKGLELDKHLYIEELQTSGGAKDAVVGTLDLHVARALPGEVLIGNLLRSALDSPWATGKFRCMKKQGGAGSILQARKRLEECEWTQSLK